jgi:deazaflavin-dependent oxidoreductase (nitroreductase family)
VSWLDGRAAEPFCYLTTRGRRSGNPHEIEIWFGVAGGRLYMLAGGRDGADWVRNIRATPAVSVRIAGETRAGRGRVVEEPAEEAVARRLLADKYDEREADGSLDEWARTALPVAVDFDD